MAKWKIELRNVGQEKAAGTILVDAADLVKAKQQAMHACRRCAAKRLDACRKEMIQ